MISFQQKKQTIRYEEEIHTKKSNLYHSDPFLANSSGHGNFLSHKIK